MSENLNCGGGPKKVEKDEIIPEECWEEMYRNDSRKWLLRDGTSKGSVKVSTIKDSYQVPQVKTDSPLLGRRTKILRDKFIREAEEEIRREANKPPEIEDYVTSYDCHYHSSDPDFHPQYEIKKNPELYDKYPLYASPGMTYWRFQHERGFGNPVQIPGQTAIVDIDNPFRRNSNFSRPIDEKDGEILH